MRQMNALNELREQGSMTWIEQEHGWVAAPEEIVNALSKDGFEECKHEMTTSRHDLRPAGGVWQGINTRTGSVALAIWVNRPAWDQAIVFIAIDGEVLKEMGTKWAQSSFPPAWGSGARSLDPPGAGLQDLSNLTSSECWRKPGRHSNTGSDRVGPCFGV